MHNNVIVLNQIVYSTLRANPILSKGQLVVSGGENISSGQDNQNGNELDTYLCKVGIRLIRLQPELQGVETFAATWQGF